MKKRFLYNEIVKYLEHKNALVITGMRQVGKTTLLRQVYDEVVHPKIWFDFDNPLDLLLFEDSNYDGIFTSLLKESNAKKNQRLFVFIDEIQNFPDITKIIKYLIDKYSVKFLVTGSSNYYLKNLFPESLNGRKFLFILPPLDFKEYMYFISDNPKPGKISINSSFKSSSIFEYKKLENDYNNFLEYGGLPEVVLTQDFETKRLILRNIFSSFFEKDLRLLSDLSDIRELRDLIILLSARTGNILDVSKLASELGVNRLKTYSYLEFLQGIFFIKLIPKFSKSIDRSVAGGRKVYFSDNGILNVFARISSGQMFENAVANQLSKFGELKYYNLRNTSKIDFILNNETALEVKNKGCERDLTALKKICNKIGIKKHYIISKEFTGAKGIIPGSSI